MLSYFRNKNQGIVANAWRCWLIMILLSGPIHCQINFKSRIVFTSKGTQFSPVNTAAQLLSTSLTTSSKMCAIACNADVLCRVFDFGVVLSQQCRLFEGDVNTMGTITTSLSPYSVVGITQISTDLFVGYGLPCSSNCQQSRYLTCNSNSTCQCIPHTYWDGSICFPQTPVLGAPCQQNMSMCREDLNYTCLPFNQCGPLSVLDGTTIADQNTVIVGSPTVGLSYPQEIIADAPTPGYILLVDRTRSLVARLSDGNSTSNNNSVVARNWTGGNQLFHPFNMFLDMNSGNNLYVSDSGSHRIVLFTGMQSVNPSPRIIAGTGIAGSTASQLNGPRGVAIDLQGYIIIADYGNHRIMLYAPNSTVGTMIAGTGTANNDSFSLNNPASLFLDKHNSWLYVADVLNHRIQRFSLNSSWPLNGTTVAGGNGAGSGSHQFDQPYGVWVSNKTGFIYIADSNNHRIQRWRPGDTNGVTIAGNPNGVSGTNATMFRNPYRVTANTNETLLYVSDGMNSRVQRFQLI